MSQRRVGFGGHLNEPPRVDTRLYPFGSSGSDCAERGLEVSFLLLK